MSELRKDPLHERWVVIAPERQRRPPRSRPSAHDHTAKPCPFCPGQEALTPREILALRPPHPTGSGDAWTVRVFPHREPALRVEGDLAPRAVGLYDVLNGVGAHEVVVERPEHAAGWADMDPAQLLTVILTWQERMRDLFRDGRLEHVSIHKAHKPPDDSLYGQAACHAHSHVIGTPVTPRVVEDEIRNGIAYHERTRRCVLCDLLDQTLRDGDRVVAEDEHVVVLTPWASRFPFELRILPRRHRHAFVDAGRDELASLARVLVDSCDRLRLALDDAPFDLCLHSAPNPRTLRPHPFAADGIPHAYHWHIELLPRVAPPDGNAAAIDLHVNPTPPEAAAAYLRGLA